MFSSRKEEKKKSLVVYLQSKRMNKLRRGDCNVRECNSGGKENFGVNVIDCKRVNRLISLIVIDKFIVFGLELRIAVKTCSIKEKDADMRKSMD